MFHFTYCQPTNWCLTKWMNWFNFPSSQHPLHRYYQEIYTKFFPQFHYGSFTLYFHYQTVEVCHWCFHLILWCISPANGFVCGAIKLDLKGRNHINNSVIFHCISTCYSGHTSTNRSSFAFQCNSYVKNISHLNC